MSHCAILTFEGEGVWLAELRAPAHTWLEENRALRMTAQLQLHPLEWRHFPNITQVFCYSMVRITYLTAGMAGTSISEKVHQPLTRGQDPEGSLMCWELTFRYQLWCCKMRANTRSPRGQHGRGGGDVEPGAWAMVIAYRCSILLSV